jgi:type II secretory ATPase GspE/PulE/Tfp pilus assembly ATPase PilB-like protein
VLKSLGIDGKPEKDLLLHRGKGCNRRKATGYYGRTAICEMMEMKGPVRNAILNGADIEGMRDASREMGMTSLRENGLQKVKNGITTPEEVLRATIEED